ncbi:MAG: hypothetical protein NTW32_14605 [Chloroflexi bacterium]|nr:hypothetical protein [Chloroflexota bacterium]
MEIEILHRDESVRTVLWNSATLFEPDGQTPIATIAQGQDITSHKQVEQVLQNTNIKLQNSVEQRDTALEEVNNKKLELEIQNEELRESQDLLDLTRARYFDLYDLAPVGYCTVNEKGLILEVNLTAANMLGATRQP